MTKTIFNNIVEKPINQTIEHVATATVIPLNVNSPPNRTSCATGQPYLYTDVQYLTNGKPDSILAECNSTNDPIISKQALTAKGLTLNQSQVLPDGTTTSVCIPSTLNNLFNNGQTWNSQPNSNGPYKLYSVPTNCNTQPATDCEGSWSDPIPSVCPSNGEQTLTYSIKKSAVNGGKPCTISNGDTKSIKCTPTTQTTSNTNLIQNVASSNSNNVPCLIANLGTDLTNPNLVCATGLATKDADKYIKSINLPNSSTVIGTKITFSSFALNSTTTAPDNTIIMLPYLNNPGLLVATDKDLIKYTIIPVNAAGNPTKAIPPEPSCTLVNTGTADKPSILCKEQLGNANVTMLPPIIPANCLINNSGTQTNPLITCQMFTPPEVKKATPTASTVVNTSGSQTTGVVSPIKVNDVKPGTLSSGTLLQTQRSSNPYTETIKTLNAKTNWTCPPGFVAQYPNQTLTECDASGTCTDFYQNPAVLSQPCMGSATSSFKYNKDPYGALDMNADIKCDYGFPIFSGINNNGVFNGNVMCLYQKGSGQIL
jgi:hypothetical protein